MAQHISHRDLRDAHVVDLGQLLRTCQALEVFRIAIAFDAEFVQVFREGVQVVGPETTTEEAAGA